MFCGIYMRAISQEVLMNLIFNISSKITLLKLSADHSGASELKIGCYKLVPVMANRVTCPICEYRKSILVPGTFESY